MDGCFKIYDVTKDQLAFTLSMIDNGFALIKVPSKYQSIINEAFTFSKTNLFLNKNDEKHLKCTHNDRYIGYTSTKDIKQSIWFYTSYHNKKVELYPKIKHQEDILNKYRSLSSENTKKPRYQQIYEQLFNNYHQIGMHLLLILLNKICLNTASTKKCYYSLFPPITMKQIHQKRNQQQQQQKPSKPLYSYSTMAIIHYYGDDQSEPHEQDEKRHDDDAQHVDDDIVCDRHIDDGFLTLISCNEPGLQVWNFKYDGEEEGKQWIDIDEILRMNGYEDDTKDRMDVLVVLRGGLFATLIGKEAIYHRVKKTFKNDRISKGFHLYPNIEHGVLDQSLIPINKKKDKLSIFDLIQNGRSMAFSVNFDK